MTDIITILDKNGKSAVYTGEYIHGIYRYLETIGAPTKLTTSVHNSHHFGPSYLIKNDTSYLHPVITALRMIQKILCKCWGSIVHKADACIIRGPKPSLRRNINQFNALSSEEPNETMRECNSQPPADHFKYITSPYNNSPLVSVITGRLNHHSVANDAVEVHPSYFSV